MKYTKTITLITTLLCFLQGQGLALAQDNPNQYNTFILLSGTDYATTPSEPYTKIATHSCGSEPPTGSTVTMVTN